MIKVESDYNVFMPFFNTCYPRVIILYIEKRIIMKARINVVDFGEIILELNNDLAPITVKNFISLVEMKVYTNAVFHRIIEGFMVQAGEGIDANKIVGEFKDNGYVYNTIKHERGVISMARTPDPNSASAQFFIMHKTSPHLDGKYAAFGKIVEGIEVIDKIAISKRDVRDRPLNPIIIKNVELIK